MVNTGKPSSGCVRCRQRRVKCDESTPECRRCVSLRLPCPGYARDVRFKAYPPTCRNATQLKTRSTSRTDVNSGTQARRKREQAGPQASSLRESSSRAHHHVLRHMDLSLRDRSVDLFMASFVYSPDSIPDETLFLDFLPDMYLSAGHNTSLSSAVAAVASLNFMNRYKAGMLSGWVTSLYAKALADTNHALSTPDTSYTDSTLAAVWLLSLFELLISDKEPHNQPQKATWSRHNIGALALLSSRGAKQLRTPRGLQLFRLVHTSAMISMMLDRQSPPEELLSMIITQLEHSPKGEIEALLVSKELHLLAQTWASDAPPINLDAQEQMNFQQAASTKPDWQPHNSTLSCDRQQSQPAYEKHYFTSGFIMSNWLTHWASQLQLHHYRLLHFHDHVHDESSLSLHGQILADMEANADQILGSVAFAFGEISSSGARTSVVSHEHAVHVGSAIGAVHILWPLGVILASPYIKDTQKSLAREAMRRVGSVFRVTRALNYV